jgi:opacity protein-like surface antigen
MKIKKSALPFALATALSAAALAEQPNYTYVEVGAFRMNLDGIPHNPTGYYIDGSAALGDSGVYLRGGYFDGDDSAYGVDVDVSGLNLGLGYQAALNDNSSWHVYADWVQPEVEVNSVSVDEDGYSLGAGVRSFVAENLELGVDIGYTDVDEEDGFGGSASATYYFADQFGVTLSGELDEDSNSAIALGLRVTF